MSAPSNVGLVAGIRTANHLAYFGVILSIWSIEAVRCCNALMPVQLYVSLSPFPTSSNTPTDLSSSLSSPNEKV
jgi:hypothetical protein